MEQPAGDQADHEAGDPREVKAPLFPFDVDVAGQSPEVDPEASEQGGEHAQDKESETNQHQPFAER